MVLNCKRASAFFHIRYHTRYLTDPWKKSGEGGIWTLAPLLTAYSLSRGAPSTTWVLLLITPNAWSLKDTTSYMKLGERREWDSNPCALADKRFSRPPRYDHFDISPCSYLLGAVKSAQKYSRCFQRHWVSYQNGQPMSTVFLSFFRVKLHEKTPENRALSGIFSVQNPLSYILWFFSFLTYI